MSEQLPKDSMLYCLTCGVPRYEFTDREIDAQRRTLAKAWGQSMSQVTEYEAVHYLREAKRS